MPCYYPGRAYRIGDKLGRVLGVVFAVKAGMNVLAEISVPCGQCIGCRLERSRQWAVRCMHEASLHDENCFITLTYNDDHLPDCGELVYEHFQLFMKRLRKKFSGRKIRFFMCGEYGDTNKRPHYHACLFGVNFNDRVHFKITSSGSKISTSQTLDDLWSDRDGNRFGFCSVGDISFDSAGYVARYAMKKSFEYESDLTAIDYETGEVLKLTREFTRMSLKPGIGLGFMRKWKSDIFPGDKCVINGVAIKPPRYYFAKLKEEDPEMYEELCFKRSEKARASSADNTAERLVVKEHVQKARLKMLKREL